MAHFANIINGTVVQVIAVENYCAPNEEEGKLFIKSIGINGDWVQTSYNTYRDQNGIPQHRNGGTPFRGQYACIGDKYDPELDEFITPAS